MTKIKVINNKEIWEIGKKIYSLIKEEGGWRAVNQIAYITKVYPKKTQLKSDINSDQAVFYNREQKNRLSGNPREYIIKSTTKLQWQCWSEVLGIDYPETGKERRRLVKMIVQGVKNE